MAGDARLDWSKTPLGPVEHGRNRCARRSARARLRVPIVLWWGPELTILYNDEYSRRSAPSIPGAGRAGAGVERDLGRHPADARRRSWSARERRARATSAPHRSRGYPRRRTSRSRTAHSREDGKVGGVFCPVIETTQKVIGERRLRTLRDLAAQCKGAETRREPTAPRRTCSPGIRATSRSR
jgi:hypothetical protein